MRMQPLLTSAVLGVADGFLVKQDVDGGRTEIGKQWATWYEAALVVAGIFLEQSGGYQFGQFTEPMELAGGALLGSRLTGWALKQTYAPMVAGASIPSFARGYVAPSAPLYGAVNKQPTDSLI